MKTNDLKHPSHIPDECQVLFSLGPVFKAEKVYLDEKNPDKWIVEMSGTNEGLETIHEHVNTDIMFGRHVIIMDEKSKVEMHLNQLISMKEKDSQEQPTILVKNGQSEFLSR
jgi:hypothetical protein